MSERIPTSQEFDECCRGAFGFLVVRGFTLEPDGEFRRRFRGPRFDVIVEGVWYGTAASVSLSDASGCVPLILLIPGSELRRRMGGLLQQVRFFADMFQAHCADLMEGRTERLHQAQAALDSITKPQRPAG